MGEPIHKLATRGVKFWAEMDQKIFSLDKKKRVPELKKMREYIIKKLNDDLKTVLADPDTQAKLREAGVEPAFMDPQQMGELMKRDVERWRQVATRIKLTLD